MDKENIVKMNDKIGDKRFKDGVWQIYTTEGWKVEAPKNNEEIRIDESMPDALKDIFGIK